MAFGENLSWLMTHRGVSNKELADYIDVKVNSISNYTHNVSTPSYDKLELIIKKLDVSADQILYGNLPVDGLKKIAPKIAPKYAPNGHNGARHMPLVVTQDTSGLELVSLVPTKAAAGYLNGYGDQEYIEKLPTLHLPGLTGDSHRAFEIRGQSMMPNLHSGAICIGRYVESFDEIRDRRVYIVVSRYDGIVVKRVLNRIKQEGKIILMSDNDNKSEYPNYPLDVEEILEVWYWRGAVIREVPEPGTQYIRINNLEARLSLVESRLLNGK